MRVATCIAAVVLFTASTSFADVTRLEHRDSPLRAAKAAKDASGARSSHMNRHASGTEGANKPTATGSIHLIDSEGLDHFINTNITFATSSSASGAMSEASYTHGVAASTSAGGTINSTLNDAYDGYQSLCVSLNGSTGICATGNANYTVYNQDGVPTTDCNGRQVVYNPQTIGPFTVFRKVFVPDNDHFARWLNYVTNTSGSPAQVTLITSNNLGSDSNTHIVATSSGDTTADTTDTWVTSFQNFSGNTSSDPRLGHIFRGPGAAIGLTSITFNNGDDNPFWAYTFTLGAGQTGIVANFGVAEATKAAAAAISDDLANERNANQWNCTTGAEKQQILNFRLETITIPTLDKIGLAALGLLLAGGAIFALRRRSA